MNKHIPTARLSIFAVCLGITFAVFSFCTITTYQLPWFDEVVYIDAARSFSLNGTFNLTVVPMRSETLHSPLYSVLTSWMFDLLGFGIVQARILPMVATLVVLTVLALSIRNTTGSIGCVLLFLLLFISDRTINFAMHNGRMDMLCLCFATISLLWFTKLVRQPLSPLSMLQAGGAGLLLAAAWLTSMRLAVAMSPCILLPILHSSGKRMSDLKHLAAFGSAAILPVLIWLWYAYGGIHRAVETTASTSVYREHFGVLNSLIGNILRRVNEAPKMILFYLLCAWLILRHRSWLRSDFFICANLLTIVGFVLFVTEKGPYRAMFLPFVYFLAAVSLPMAGIPSTRKLFTAACLLILCLNLAANAPRLGYIIRHSRELDHSRVSEQLAQWIRPGDHVITDMQFYYALRQIGAEIRVVELDKLEHPGYKAALCHEFRPQYILSNHAQILALLPGELIHTPEPGHFQAEGMLDRIIHQEHVIMPREVYDAKLKKIAAKR